ncbi:MAG: hypothetical protein ABIF08_02360 [Nanoarchaeota archaeon]
MVWEKTVMDELHDKTRTKPFDLLGTAMSIRPENQGITIDYTTKMGGASNLYYGLVFWLPKQDYNVVKVDEYMEVSPTHVDTYNLTIAQKQKLEGAIKTGLASAAQAVADFELLKHDHRRYREIWDYFKKGKKDDHVLRSLFIDRVDAYTGEGFSLVTMTKRWPTIITDFIRLGGKELETVDEIRKEIDVSQAEATVLKTKNELYLEWKELFFPTVKERLARIENMVKSREKSVEEYKNWLKPYVARYRMMREATEARPEVFSQDYLMTPGFSQAVAFTGVRLWVWKPFELKETGKPEFVPKKGKWLIDPYDDFVRYWKKKIAEKYKVPITDKDVEDIKNNAITEGLHDKKQYEMSQTRMDPRYLYYQMFDMKIARTIIKTPPPEGGELENIMFWPLETWVISQNVLLCHLIELHARNEHFKRYVEELVGSKNLEDEIRERLESEYEGKEKIKKTEKKKPFSGAGSGMKKFGGLFVKKGPYESNFAERITKVYLVNSGSAFGEMLGHIKSLMGAT